MTIPTIFHIFLMLHLIGFVLFAGTTIVNFVTLKQFWKQYEEDTIKARAVFQALSKFPILMRIGIAAIILSGVGMMGLTNGVFGEQLWFRIKFGLVILIILNNLLVGRRQGINLKKILDEGTSVVSEKLHKIKSNFRLFHAIQLILFLAILLLSVFKFN